MQTHRRLLTPHIEGAAGFSYYARKYYRSRNMLLAGEAIVPEPESPNVTALLLPGIRHGFQAAYQARWSGLIVIALIAAVVGSYYAIPATSRTYSAIMALKESNQLLFSFLSIGIAGGILPVALGLCTGMYKSVRKAGTHAAYGLLVFGLLGLMNNYLYAFQSYLFGAGNGLGTVLTKIAFDQFVWTVLIANPYQLAVLMFRDGGFRGSAFNEATRSPVAYYLTKGFPALLNNWCFWIPLTGLIYSLPEALQIPVASLAVAFWVVLLSLTVKPEKA